MLKRWMAILSKLKDKLKKLFLYRFRYKVKIKKDLFLYYNLHGFEINVDDEYVILHTNKINKNLINNEEIIIKDNYKRLASYLFKSKLLTSCSLLFILLLFLTSSFFVREITFSDPLTYDYMVLEDVKGYIKRFGPFYYIKENLNNVSSDLRVKYYNYSYIGVRKNGSKLIIDIEEVQDYPNIDNNDKLPCDIVAGTEGKVVGIEVVSGISLVNINDIVTKEQVLVTGNLNYHTNINNLNNLVASNGYVLIEYAKYEKIQIDKVLVYNELGKGFENYFEFSFFNFVIGKSRKEFNNYYIVCDNIFMLGNKIKLTSISKYEKVVSEYSFNIDTAKEQAVLQIYQNFLNDKISEKETIKMIKFIQVEQTDHVYIFHFLVKYIKNETIKKYYN